MEGDAHPPYFYSKILELLTCAAFDTVFIFRNIPLDFFNFFCLCCKGEEMKKFNSLVFN
jgi:hypothetical protein